MQSISGSLSVLRWCIIRRRVHWVFPSHFYSIYYNACLTLIWAIQGTLKKIARNYDFESLHLRWWYRNLLFFCISIKWKNGLSLQTSFIEISNYFVKNVDRIIHFKPNRFFKKLVFFFHFYWVWKTELILLIKIINNFCLHVFYYLRRDL